MAGSQSLRPQNTRVLVVVSRFEIFTGRKVTFSCRISSTVLYMYGGPMKTVCWFCQEDELLDYSLDT